MEVHEERDFDSAWEKLVEVDPGRCIFSYSQVMAYLSATKVKRVRVRESPRYVVKPWKLPRVLVKWKEENVDSRPSGRCRPLVLVGGAMLGKTEWARSFGKPIDMTKRWNMSAVCVGATHVVVNDVDVRMFGYGESYWREVLGCQTQFDASDKCLGVRTLMWDIPCVWTCNASNDPRQFEDVSVYLEEVCAVVVELNEPLY